MGEAVKEWVQCESRGPWLRNSLRHRIGELQRASARCRNSFKKGVMVDPSFWLADAYDEAANALQKRLDELSK